MNTPCTLPLFWLNSLPNVAELQTLNTSSQTHLEYLLLELGNSFNIVFNDKKPKKAWFGTRDKILILLLINQIRANKTK
jgi:predicted nuclease of restriction endonuclease-like (RecB) superfamily